MTSHTGKQVIIIHILPNISRSKGNQAIKFSHLIAYKVRNILLQNSRRNVTGRLVLGLPFFKKRASCEVRSSSQHLELGHLELDLDIS